MTFPAHTLARRGTAIPGLSIWDLPVHGDSRGWFKENWQREKMVAAGLPDFGPVQNNISFNGEVGVTRGIHAEPWDKWVSVATGRIFGAWVDLREGPTFGAVATAEIDAGAAVFVPHGVGNAYQTLEPATVYTYLVNEHWSPDAAYTFVNLADESLAIDWPVPLGEAVVSDKDRAHPQLSEVTPVHPRQILVLGAGGQLGRALRTELGDMDQVDYATRDDIDLAAGDLDTVRDWADYDTVINAAAFTGVDDAETHEGRAQAWATNVTGVAALARVAARHRLTLVHVSSDYVFDGTSPRPYREDDPLCPLGVYGQTKAAGDAIAATVARHYIVRTSWVIGQGRNFVATMTDLAERGVDPEVVDDQIGRPSFTAELASAIRHLLDHDIGYGTYHVTADGDPASWYEIAREVFANAGYDPARVHRVSTEQYRSRRAEERAAAGRTSYAIAPRPANSALDLTKIKLTGFHPRDWRDRLRRHMNRLV